MNPWATRLLFWSFEWIMRTSLAHTHISFRVEVRALSQPLLRSASISLSLRPSIVACERVEKLHQRMEYCVLRWMCLVIRSNGLIFCIVIIPVDAFRILDEAIICVGAKSVHVANSSKKRQCDLRLESACVNRRAIPV